jgi:UDP-N-acetylglucosamine acyltransferase
MIGSHVVIEAQRQLASPTAFPFYVIGVQPQDLKFKGEETFLTIGSHNEFQECVNVHRGTKGGRACRMVTTIF